MSKKQNTTKREVAFNHVIEKKSGSRGTYFDMPDEQTTYGTGKGEMLFKAAGFNDMDSKKHWKKGHRPFGSRRDYGICMSQLSDAHLHNTDVRVEMDMSPELQTLNHSWFEKVLKPNLHKLQDLRKNPTLKKARRSAEVYANELAHYSKNPEELKELVAKQNAGTLEFVSEEMKETVIDAFAQQFIADRKSKLEVMKKI